MIPLALRFLLGLLVALFAAFIASHYRRLTLGQQVALWGGIYGAVFAGLAVVPDETRLRFLGPLAWIFSSAPTWREAWMPLLLAWSAFVLVVIWFVPRYEARGLGDPQGTLRLVPFPFRAVALTFDDGPSPTWTPQVLEVLKKHQVKATFFMAGQQVEKHPELAREVRRQGHSVGSHAWSHARPLPLLDRATLKHELGRTHDVLTQVLGEAPRFFRPPWGMCNRVVLDEARAHGYLTVLWSRSSQDWRNPGVERILALSSRDIEMGEIILMHDGGNLPTSDATSRQQTVDAVERLVPMLEAQGFQFKTLDEAVDAWLS